MCEAGRDAGYCEGASPGTTEAFASVPDAARWEYLE